MDRRMFLGGTMIPTEASVVAVNREISWSQLPEILNQSAAVTGTVGLLLATAGVISWFLTIQQLPTMLIRLMTIVPGGSLVFLLITDRPTRDPSSSCSAWASWSSLSRHGSPWFCREPSSCCDSPLSRGRATMTAPDWLG